MVETLKVGFIGAGANTRLMHLPGFEAIEGVELASVANRSVDSARKVAEEFGIRRVENTWQAILEDPEIDAVCIGTWPNLHSEVTVAALKRGKHVLCEARMARSLQEAESMLEAAKLTQDSIVSQLVPAPFSLEFDSTIQEIVDSGQLGQILEVRVLHSGGQYARPDSPMTWRLDRELSGQNILTMGICHETVQRWLRGDNADWLIAVGEVFQEHRTCPELQESQSVEIPESLSVLGAFQETGARLIYHFSGVESGVPTMDFRINGDAGALRFDGVNRKLYFAQAGSATYKEIEPDKSSRVGWQVEADFVNSIRTGAPVRLTSFEAGIAYMKFTDQVNRSLEQSGARVTG